MFVDFINYDKFPFFIYLFPINKFNKKLINRYAPIQSPRSHDSIQLSNIVYYRNISTIIIFRSSQWKTNNRFIIVKVKSVISKKIQIVLVVIIYVYTSHFHV